MHACSRALYLLNNPCFLWWRANTLAQQAGMLLTRSALLRSTLWFPLAQVDGFRFDIMGHLLMRTMHKIRGALDALTLERDGVDGKMMYIYGEAWDFGEVGSSRMA